jgi:protein TonB
METRFIIPAAFALSLHAFVLFAFPRVPGAAQVLAPRPSEPQVTPVVFENPPEEQTSDERQEAIARGAPDPVSRLPEPPVPPERPSAEIPCLPPSEHQDDDRAVTKIPAGSYGDPRGSSDQCGPGIITSSMLDNLPRTRSQAAPVYPYGARSSGRPGEVLVVFTVDETGRVLDPQVVRSTDRIFEDPTLRAVAKWRFEPGRRNGRVVRFRMGVPVQFSVKP